MKSKVLSLFSGTGAAALILLAACQQSESPTQSKPSDTGTQAQEQGLKASEGRKAAPEEIASGMEAIKDLPALERQTGLAPLAKSAALATCIVDFNNAISLGYLYHEAAQFTVNSPWYRHVCNGSYVVYTQPINAQSYKLYPEKPYCAGPPTMNLIGKVVDGACVAWEQGKYVPRTVSNLGGSSGVQFYVMDGAGVMKNFNIQAMTMVSGDAQVTANRVGIGAWKWYPFDTPTRYFWPAGTAVKWIVVSSNGLNGTVKFDKIEISIIP